MANKKFSEFVLKTSTSDVSHIVGYNGAENVQITPANFLDTTGGPYLPLAGGTMTGNTIHNDNVKSIYGTGSDLEIYHDGSSSYIKDVGTGDLRIWADNPNISTLSGNKYFYGNNGSAELFHSGNKKLVTISTGVEVTGIATLTGNLSIDSSLPSINLTDTDNNALGRLRGSSGNVIIQSDVNNIEASSIVRFDIDGLEKMRLDASGNLGLGTSTPSSKFEIAGINQTGSKSAFRIQNDTTNTKFEIKSISGDYNVQFKNAGNIVRVLLDSNGNSYLNGGNVGIGTDSPTTKLNVLSTKTVALSTAADFLTLGLTVDDDNAYNTGNVGGGIAFRGKRNTSGIQTVYGAIDVSKENTDNDTYLGAMRFYTNQNATGVPLERMRINSAGNVGVGMTSGFNAVSGTETTVGILNSNVASLYLQSTGTNGKKYGIYSASSGQLAFYDFTDGSERMRLTSTGSVLIGKTADNDGTVGARIVGTGLISATRSGNVVAIFDRTTSDGNLVLFRRDATQVGSISVNTTSTTYNTSSDYRLKEDLQDFKGLDLVSKIPVYDYKWKADDSRSYGVMAHELEEVLPQAVSGEKDAEEMQSVDYSKIVPLLVKSIQELSAKLEALECQCENK